jgi:hypothetical protein
MVNLDDGEVWRIQRARAALLLGLRPSEVDDMPPQDIDDVIAIAHAEKELEAWAMRKR